LIQLRWSGIGPDGSSHRQTSFGSMFARAICTRPAAADPDKMGNATSAFLDKVTSRAYRPARADRYW